jgi:branched-chain amino acid transport system substrate-binding protein
MTRLMGFFVAFALAFAPAAQAQTESQPTRPQATNPQATQPQAPTAQAPKPQAPKAQAPAQPQIKFGVAGPFTGQNAAFGAQLKNGAEQAIADINAAGGILKQKIGVSIGDDASDARQGVSVANKLASSGVKFVIGHFNSGVTIPASDVYMESAVLMVSPASTSPKVTERGLWNVFRTCGRDDQQGMIAGDYIRRNFKGRKIAIVHDKTTYGQGLAEETRNAMAAGGLLETLNESIIVGTKDFGTLVAKIKASGAELVYYGGTHVEAALLLRQMRDQGVTATLMAADGITDDDFAAVAGPAAEGTLMTFPRDPRKRPEAAAAVARFREKNFEPHAYTLYAYAAVEIIKQAAGEAKSLDPRRVAMVMRSGRKFSTVIGDITFDLKGDVTRPDYVMYVWKKNAGGKITYVELE